MWPVPRGRVFNPGEQAQKNLRSVFFKKLAGESDIAGQLGRFSLKCAVRTDEIG